jgi:predicted nucleic acid-binding Zn ribbon protein
MFHARRLASAVAVAAVALTGLSACRSAPDVAAYRDSGNITTAQVQRIYDDAKTKAGSAASPAPAATADPTAAPAQFPLTQGAVLDTMISHDVLSGLAKKHSVTLPDIGQALPQYAQLLHLPATAEYVRMYVEVEAYQYALNQAGTGGTPTNAELNEVFQRLKDDKLVDPATTSAQFLTSLSADAKKTLGSAIATKNEVRDELTAEHLRLNPRFGTFEVPIYTQRDQNTGAASVLVGQPVGKSDTQVPVTDAP